MPGIYPDPAEGDGRGFFSTDGNVNQKGFDYLKVVLRPETLVTDVLS